MIKIQNPYIKIDTEKTTLLLKVEEWGAGHPEYHPKNLFKGVAILYYGSRISDFDNYDVFGIKPLIIDRVGGSIDDYIRGAMTHSSVGIGANREVLLEVNNADGVNVNRFDFVNARVLDGGVEFNDMPFARGGQQTLELEFYDEFEKLRLFQRYTVFADSNVIAACQKLVNETEQKISFRRLMSLQLDLHDSEWIVSSYDGVWGGERNRNDTLLKSGLYCIDSKTGASSPNHNPFFTIAGTGINGNIYGFNLIYSGNHKELVQISPYGGTRVLVGMNDYLLDYALQGGESFETPQAIMVNGTSIDEVTLDMHKFTMNHIIHPDFARKERPVLYNHWEGTGVDFDEKILLDFADTAQKLGIELFVMDDGWFGNRIDDKRALGDWFVNKNKFPNGLKGLSDGIKAKGMQFGIWVEPEMINRDSDLYRMHPEYALEIPGREPIERRRQLVIDMTNEEVRAYLLKVLSYMIDECNPDYIKWDYNRTIIDVYSHKGTKAGEFYHKFILGTYKLIHALRRKYPQILFESCSAGGGRYDLGMFFYMPQAWGSDNSSSWDRTDIHCGTLTAYPQSTLGSHVTKDHFGTGYNKTASIEDRFNVNCVGAFGYEFDINAFSKEELLLMANQIKFYKRHRKLLQFGEYYCINNVFDDKDIYSYIVVSQDKTQAMFTLIERNGHANVLPKRYKLKGLAPDKTYKLTMRKQENVEAEKTFTFTAKGDMLLNYGLDFDIVGQTKDNEQFGGLTSRMYYIEEI